MSILGAAGIGAGAALASTVAGGLFGSSQAKKNRKFQEYMASTAYQRAMKDMRLAGLNPMLAYQKGGANTPGGAMAPPLQGFGQGISTALRLKQELKNMKMVEMKDESQTDLNDANISLAESQETLTNTTALKVASEFRHSKMREPGAKAYESLDKTELGGALRWLNKLIKSVTGREQSN